MQLNTKLMPVDSATSVSMLAVRWRSCLTALIKNSRPQYMKLANASNKATWLAISRLPSGNQCMETAMTERAKSHESSVRRRSNV